MQGWHRGFLKGQTGLVPSTHLMASASVPVASSTTGTVTLRVKASHDYTARQSDELSFAKLEELDVYPDCVEVMVVVHVDICKEDEILVLTWFRTCSRAGTRASNLTNRAALSLAHTLMSRQSMR